MSNPTPEPNHGMRADASGKGAQASATLTGRNRALDEAAAELVAAWDTDIDARTPAEGQRALDRLKPSAAVVSSLPASGEWTDDSPIASGTGSRKGWLLGVVACAALLLGWLAMRGDDSPSAAAHEAPLSALNQPPTVEKLAGEAPVEAATELQPTAPAQPTRFALTVRTVPADAELRVGGERVGNPYTGEHEADQTVRIAASADGHEATRRTLSLDGDMNLMLTLPPEKRAAPTPRPRRVKKQRARRRAQKRDRSRERARERKARAAARAKKAPAKKKAAGFVSSNPYQ